MRANTDGATQFLRNRWLWYRHAYPYLWAHRPLCSRFERGVIRIGRARVCRSCTLLYVGMLLSVISWWVLTPGIQLLYLLAAIGVPLIAAISHPACHRHLPRSARDAFRFAAGALIPLPIALLLSGAYGVGALLLGAYVIYYRLANRAYQREKLTACAGCPELTGQGVCSGYRLHAECLREYDEALERDRQARGYGPPCGAGF